MIVATRRAVHIGVYIPESVPIATIESLFSFYGNWARYNRYCWILFTTSSLDAVRDALRAVPGLTNNNLLLCEFDPSNLQWIPTEMDVALDC